MVAVDVYALGMSIVDIHIVKHLETVTCSNSARFFSVRSWKVPDLSLRTDGHVAPAIWEQFVTVLYVGKSKAHYKRDSTGIQRWLCDLWRDCPIFSRTLWRGFWVHFRNISRCEIGYSSALYRTRPKAVSLFDNPRFSLRRRQRVALFPPLIRRLFLLFPFFPSIRLFPLCVFP